MSPTGRTPAENVEEARYHLQFVVTYLDEPATQVAPDAIAMRLSAALEAISALPVEMRDRVCMGEWKEMWGMRNRIAHGYALTDGRLLRTTAERDVPTLLTRLAAELT
ncbi:HepT-like ribonuclease domain-containing protein [Dermacoccus barathri]|nr:HepT-like ribonuclease domain-containing protein [Dermacoccus barathri]MBE7370683.1 DUF86 domain-containing protein [Dermacoccus barathri]